MIDGPPVQVVEVSSDLAATIEVQTALQFVEYPLRQ
ncbi:MAG: hypothetical protein ACI91O_000919 [Candidatus Poriferisodalaceae bacterium]